MDPEFMRTMTKHMNLKCDLYEQKYKHNDSTHKRLLKELKEVDDYYYTLCMRDFSIAPFGDKPEKIQKEEWDMFKKMGK